LFGLKATELKLNMTFYEVTVLTFVTATYICLPTQS
jgi:hypothetical protein